LDELKPKNLELKTLKALSLQVIYKLQLTLCFLNFCELLLAMWALEVDNLLSNFFSFKF
jgi:hypothetical protein